MRSRTKLYGYAVALVVLAACSANSGSNASAAATRADARPGATQPDAAAEAEFADFIREKGQSPEDYIVGKFKDHDVVLLGENHRISQNLLLLQALIPRLHEAGVYALGWEFVDSHRQQDIDRLLVGERYDEALASDLILEHRDLLYGHVEYADVLRAAWKVNRNVSPGGRKFRILGLDKPLYPTEWSQMKPGEKGSDPQVRHRVFGLGALGRDIHWALVFDREVLQKGEKALVYAGAGHTSTRFVNAGRSGFFDLDVGNYVYGVIQKRAFRVSLHGTEGKDVSGTMETLISAAGSAKRRLGFDVSPGTPVGRIPSDKVGCLPPDGKDVPARCSDLTLADVTDGYVYLDPIEDFRIVRRIEGLLTPANVRKVTRQMQLESGDRNLTYIREQLEEMMLDHDWKSQWLIRSIRPFAESEPFVPRKEEANK